MTINKAACRFIYLVYNYDIFKPNENLHTIRVVQSVCSMHNFHFRY